MSSYLVWIIVGLFLSAAEIFVGAFVLLVIGISALLTGIVVAIININSIGGQFGLFLFFLLVVGAAVYTLTKSMKGPSIGQANQFVGEVGMVINALQNPQSLKFGGQVRFQKPILGAEVWEFTLLDQATIKIGERVRLHSFQGKMVLVEPVNGVVSSS